MHQLEVKDMQTMQSPVLKNGLPFQAPAKALNAKSLNLWKVKVATCCVSSCLLIINAKWWPRDVVSMTNL